MSLGRPSGPLWATVNITGVCNLECEYCFFQPRKYQHMPVASFRRVVGMLKAEQLFFLTLSGGEPFTHPRIRDILTIAHHQFEYVTVLSNGTILRDAVLDCIKEIIARKGCFAMQVSLDAIDPQTNDKTRGMATRVLRNLERLREAGVSLTIAIVVSSQNIDYVVRTIVQARHLTTHFHVMPFKPVPYLDQGDRYLRTTAGDMHAVWEALARVRDEHDLQIKLPTDDCTPESFTARGAPCVAGFTQLVIDPDLDVRACSRCTHAIVGNLGEESLEQIWNGPKLARIYQRDLPYCYSPEEWAAAIADPAFRRDKRGAKMTHH